MTKRVSDEAADVTVLGQFIINIQHSLRKAARVIRNLSWLDAKGSDAQKVIMALMGD